MSQASSLPRGRKRRNFGIVQDADDTPAVSHDHSLFYDIQGLVASEVVEGVRIAEDISPGDLQDEFMSMDFRGSAMADAHDHPHELGPSYTALDVNGEPYFDGDDGQEEDDSGEEGEPSAGGKRKRNASDDPMAEWKPFLDLFIEETLRRHGLGDATGRSRCSTCGKNLNVEDDVEGSPVSEKERALRCMSCGDFLECSSCCLNRHSRMPLHFIEIWRNGSWERTTLHELGLVYQIGHQGAPCTYPEATPRLMTVLHITGVHTVAYRYCDCGLSDGLHKWQQLLRTNWYPATTHVPSTCVTMEMLSLYRRLKVIATVNVRDFVSTLESLSNPFETIWTPDRYKAVGRVSRQWNFMQRARRSGVVLDPGGLAAARTGALVVECWACPRLGVNLPPGWDTVADKYRYRYRRIVSTDANFRMSNKLKPMAHPDPPLYSGLGVQMPVEQYETWLRSYVTEEEVSNCAAFAALMQKDTRFTVGLRWSGVLGVICARHEIMLGLGNLQKGERYKNTDFVLYTVLSRMGIKEAGITYNIACQYKKHFFERIQALPAELRCLELPEITWGLPVWHGNVHDPYCETSESLKYKVGMGKTDGEGPEQVWSILNPMSYMTKEEHPGARHDDIEDKVNLHNFLKNVRSGYSLLRRLRLALVERTVQVQAFLAVEQGVTNRQRREWSQKVLDWIADSRKPSPYIAPKRGVPLPTEAQARLDLRKQEEEDSRIDSSTSAEVGGAGTSEPPRPRTQQKKGAAKKQNQVQISETGFLIAGMRLEESKQRLRQDRGGTLTVDRQEKIHARRHAVAMREKEFRKWQHKFMPGVKDVMERDEMERRMLNRPLPPVEDTQLYMPSAFGNLDEEERLEICAATLFDKEAVLRRGQCADALERLRTQLLSRRHFLNFRNGNIVGQNKTTRAVKLIERLGQSVKESTRKYRYCRAALRDIVGEEQCGELRDLLDEDVDVPDLAEPDDDAVKDLGRLGGQEGRVTGTTKKSRSNGKGKGHRTAPGETRSIMSWIWTAGGVTDDDEYVHECVRIEWSKALARKARWGEEVEMLKEEMRRVLRSVKSEEMEWRRRSEMENSHLRAEERGGRRGYAMKQVKYRVAIRQEFIALWLAEEPSQGQKAGIMDGEAQKALRRLVDSENGVPGAEAEDGGPREAGNGAEDAGPNDAEAVPSGGWPNLGENNGGSYQLLDKRQICTAAGHKLACQVNFSLNVQPGVAMTDAESPERTWFLLNNSAPSTKEMLPGGRRDMLDRRIGSHNWDKFVKLPTAINEKVYNIAESLEKNETAHEQFSLILPEKEVAGWTEEVVAWEMDRAKPNPYFQAQSHKSEQSVKQAIAEEERKTALDTPPLHETSPSVMLSLAFMVEDLARRVEQVLASDDKDAPAAVQEIHDKRSQIGVHLRQLRELQRVYMPAVAAKLQATAGSRIGDVEEEKLWLPSELEQTLRDEGGCQKGLSVIEDKMRLAQCFDALDTIRKMEAAKRTLIAFRKQNIRGNRRTGRAHTVVKRLEAKSALAVAKYRTARSALFELRGEGAWENLLKPLLDSDIKALDGVAFDIELPKDKKQKTGKAQRVDPLQQLGSGSQSISWIWLMEGAVGEDPTELNGTVRVEWLKSRARVNRRREECRLLRREKENILMSLEFEACEWEKRGAPWDGLDEAETEGVRALAARQAAMFRALARNALAIWSQPPKSHTKTVPDRIGVKEFEEEEESDDDEAEAEALRAAREDALNDEDATLDDD